METSSGLVHAYVLDAAGGGRQIDWPGIEEWSNAEGPLWVHLDRNDDRARRWLTERAGVPRLVAEALLHEETRPRCTGFPQGLLVILRGVNLNPGADPEDMVALRLWAERDRMITVRARRLMAVQDVREALDDGRGPRSIGDLLVTLSARLAERVNPVIEGMDDTVDRLEDELLDRESRDVRLKLRTVRREAIGIRRHLAPQRDALARIQQEAQDWLEQAHRLRLREVQDRVTRAVEELDEIRERAAIVQDELMNRLSEQMNRTMYVLTLVASILLPASFVTGLLGVNVGGIPGSDDPLAFAILVGFLAVLALTQILIFRRLRWL